MGFGKDGKGAIIRETATITIGTLADSAAIKSAALSITDDFRILKSVVTAHIIGLTTGEGDGYLLGMCNDDLSDLAIAAAVSADGPLNRSDRDKAELAERWVKIIAMLDGNGVAGEERFRGEGNSMLIDVKPRWTFTKGVGWAWFLFNNGAAPTTGGVVRVQATHYGVWVT